MRDLTLVFDLDGTLVDTAPDLIHATNHVLLTLGHPPVTGETVRPWISFGARRMIEARSSPGDSRTDPEHDTALERFLEYYAANIAVDSRPFPARSRRSTDSLPAGQGSPSAPTSVDVMRVRYSTSSA